MVLLCRKQAVAEIALLALYCILISQTHAYIPLFIRGRPTGGFLGSPKESNLPDNFALAPDNWFKQRLDHSNSLDLRTWQQRYFYNDTSFRAHKNAPVFLMIGGEGRANPIWVAVGSMMKYAEKYGALCFLLEHRFYGASHPLG